MNESAPKPPAPPTGKRPVGRPPNPPKTSTPSPAASAARSGSTADTLESQAATAGDFVAFDATEIREALEALADAAVELFGEEFRLEPKRAAKMGDRWAKVLNRLCQNAAGKAAAVVLARVTLIVAVADLALFLISRTLRYLARRKAERAAAPKKSTTPQSDTRDDAQSSGARRDPGALGVGSGGRVAGATA